MRNEIFFLLRSFDKKELLEFQKFLISPFFNQSSKVIALFKEISRFHPFYDQKILNKHTLFQKIYKTNRYNASTLKNLFHQLFHLCETYLIYKSFRTDVFASSNFLLKELYDRELENLFKRKAKLMAKDFVNCSCYDGNQFYNLFRYESYLYNFKKTSAKSTKKGKILEPLKNLDNSTVCLYAHFISELASQFVNQTIAKYKYNVDLFPLSSNILEAMNWDKILKKIEHTPAKKYLSLYTILFKMFADLNSNCFYHEYRNVVSECKQLMSKDELSFHYFCLISYLILKGNSEPDNLEISFQLFEIYKEVLEKEYYIDNKIQYLPNSLFRAVLFLAIKLKQIEWIKNFVDEYSNRVLPRSKDNMFNYGYSYYYFLIGEHFLSLDCINKINFDYFQYKYDLKILKLKIFYELDYLEETLQNIHTYREFLRVDKLLDVNTKTLHKNFLCFLEKLVFFKSTNEANDLDFIQHQLQNLDKVLYKDWLICKFNLINSQKYADSSF